MEKIKYPQEIESYLLSEYIVNLPEDVKDVIRNVRTNYEYMAPEVLQQLKETRIVKPIFSTKGKKRRSYFVHPDSGEVLYFNYVSLQYEPLAIFRSEEELMEDFKQHQEGKIAAKEKKKLKKKLKKEIAKMASITAPQSDLRASYKEEIIKPKRKRIQKY